MPKWILDKKKIRESRQKARQIVGIHKGTAREGFQNFSRQCRQSGEPINYDKRILNYKIGNAYFALKYSWAYFFRFSWRTWASIWRQSSSWAYFRRGPYSNPSISSYSLFGLTCQLPRTLENRYTHPRLLELFYCQEWIYELFQSFIFSNAGRGYSLWLNYSNKLKKQNDWAGINPLKWLIMPLR